MCNFLPAELNEINSGIRSVMMQNTSPQQCRGVQIVLRGNTCCRELSDAFTLQPVSQLDRFSCQGPQYNDSRPDSFALSHRACDHIPKWQSMTMKDFTQCTDSLTGQEALQPIAFCTCRSPKLSRANLNFKPRQSPWSESALQ